MKRMYTDAEIKSLAVGASISSLDLVVGEPTVSYDTTDGITIDSTGKINGTEDIVVSQEIPIIPGDNIVIDKASNSEKIEIKADLSSKQDKITAATYITAAGVTSNTVRAKKQLNADGVLETIDSVTYRRFFNSSAGNHTYKILGKELSLGTSSAILPETTGHLVIEEGLKTINGESIVGTGNIDTLRYKHVVTIDSEEYGSILVTLYSSNANEITSFEELQYHAGTTTVSASGLISNYSSRSGAVQWLSFSTGSTCSAIYLSNDALYDAPISDLNFAITDEVVTL